MIMSKASAIVRYDGPALLEHSMDVSDLAPALSGLSEIIKIANKSENSGQSAVRVFVKSDVEHQCFQVSIEVVQTVLQQVSLLLNSEKAKDAKTLLEWIGILGGGAGVTYYSLFKAYKWLVKQNVQFSELETKEEGEQVTITNSNGNTITMNKHVYNLVGNNKVIHNVKHVVSPLPNDRYDTLQFESDGEITDEISSDEGRLIHGINPETITVRRSVNISTLRAKVKVKKPDLLGESKWSVLFDRAIVAKIEDIDWLGKFHRAEIPIAPGSYLDVTLRIEIELDTNNNPIDDPKYYISEVFSVIPPDQQDRLFQ